MSNIDGMESSVEEMEGTDVPASGKGRGKYLVLLGLSVYCGAIWYFGWRDIRDQVLGADFLMLGASTGIILLATWMRVLKWRYALGEGQHAAGLFFMSKATGDLTPGRLGEFAPMVIRNHRTAKVGAWILFDRIVEILATIALGLYGLSMIDLVTRGQMGLVIGGAIVGSIVGIYLLTHRGMFLWMAARLKEGAMPHKVLALLAEISEEIFQFMRSLPLVVTITVVTKAMDLFSVMMIFRALGVFPSFGLVAAAKCALAIVSFLPITPTATGAPHGMQAWLMNRVAEIPADALLAGIGIEVLIVSMTFWVSAAFGMRFIKDAALAGRES